MTDRPEASRESSERYGLRVFLPCRQRFWQRLERANTKGGISGRTGGCWGGRWWRVQCFRVLFNRRTVIGLRISTAERSHGRQEMSFTQWCADKRASSAIYDYMRACRTMFQNRIRPLSKPSLRDRQLSIAWAVVLSPLLGH
jgi:hypothetical protein